MPNNQRFRGATSMKQLKGIIPALLTPFTRQNKINEQALAQLVKMNLEKGVSGFYVGGSTSEAFLMSLEERKYILDIVMQESKGKCAIIYHIGSISTDQAIELGMHAERAGVDAVSAVAPFYYNFSNEEIKEYYFEIASGVRLPMIIYNFPAFSGVNFKREDFLAFFQDERFIGVKHTSTDFFALERLKQMKQDLLVYNGFDEMFLAGLIMGADGGIGSTYNFMAEKFIQIKRHFDSGSIAEAQQLQSEVNDIIAAIIKIGVIPAEKEILNLMGLDFGTCRRPFKRISDEEREGLKWILNQLVS